MRDSSGARGRATTGHRQTQHRAARRHGHANIPWQAWRRQAARAQRPRPWRQQRPAQQHCAKRGEGRGDGGQREHGAAGTCTGRVVWARPRAADWRPHSRAASPRRHRRQCGAELRCVLCQPTGANWAPRAKQAAGAPLARPPPAAASPRRESRAPRAVRAAERTPRARADTHRGSIILVLALDSAPSVTRKFFCSWACGKDANPGNGVA